MRYRYLRHSVCGGAIVEDENVLKCEDCGIEVERDFQIVLLSEEYKYA